MIKKYPNELGIISKDDQHIELNFNIPEDLFWFQGHFESHPILAGVVQVDWVLYYFTRTFGNQYIFDGIVNVKFQQPIIPNEHIVLKICLQSPYLTFEYASNEHLKSKGKIKLKNYA